VIGTQRLEERQEKSSRPSRSSSRKTSKETGQLENKQQAKKEWTKPELTVLVRNKPEETVLTACKRDMNGGPGAPTATNNQCWADDFVACNSFCSSRSSS